MVNGFIHTGCVDAEDRMKQVGAQLVSVEAAKEAAVDLPGGPERTAVPITKIERQMPGI